MATSETTKSDKDDGMAIHLNRATVGTSVLPLRNSPVRFAVIGGNGLSSHAWGVYVEKGEEIYIICRDAKNVPKISLHGSGKQHIAFSEETGPTMADGGRFWNQRREPPYYGSPKVVPSFTLLFPSWSLGLTYEMREGNPKVWKKNQVLVEGAESPMATLVSFLITDDDLRMRQGESPSFPLAVIPARPGKKLWIVAHHEPEGNMRDIAAMAIRDADAKQGRHLHDDHEGNVLDMCLTGPGGEAGAYMMQLPVRIK